MTELGMVMRWSGLQCYVAVDAAGAVLVSVYAQDAETARGQMRGTLRRLGELERWNRGGQVVRVAGLGR